MSKKHSIGMGLDRLLSHVQLELHYPSTQQDAAKMQNQIADQLSDARNQRQPAADDPKDTFRVRQIAIDALQPSTYQPRTHFDAAELETLAQSIRQHGLLQPLVVRPLPPQSTETTAQRYEIVVGERRWRATKLAGLATIPVTIRPLTDQQATALALIENLQREDLTTWEVVQALQKLVQLFHLTHQQAAQLIGLSRVSVSNLLRLLELPPAVQQLLQTQQLEMGQARALLALNQYPEQQLALAQRVATQQLTVRATEQLVNSIKLKLTQAAAPVASQKDHTSASASVYNLAGLTSHLAQRLDLRSQQIQVKLGKKQGSGQITIKFNNSQELAQLMNKLGVEQRSDDVNE